MTAQGDPTTKSEAWHQAREDEFRNAAMELAKEGAALAPELLNFEAGLVKAANLMATDGRAAVRLAVRAAYDLVSAHPRWSGQGLFSPFFALLAALEELDRGKVHPMLKAKTESVGNRPEHGLNRQRAKAYTCFFLERLLATGDSPETACRALADVWETLGLPIGGQRETPRWKTIRGWRAGISKLPLERPERYLLQAMRDNYGTTEWPDRAGILTDFERVLTALGQSVLEIAPL